MPWDTAMPANGHSAGRARNRGLGAVMFAAATIAGMSAGAALADGIKLASAPATDPAAAEAPVDAAAEVAAIPADEPLAPAVVARVDLSDQTMTIYVDEKLSYVFKVSTGRRGYGTPTGQWNAEWLSPNHRSKKYHNAPMPWSVFFHGGYAVHGTTEVRRLGLPASHGCVRLHPANAKIFYKLVQENGKENTLVSIVR
jgi:lipoprotein-anchoring transpeptidase ErfK/SrfK